MELDKQGVEHGGCVCGQEREFFVSEYAEAEACEEGWAVEPEQGEHGRCGAEPEDEGGEVGV